MESDCGWAQKTIINELTEGMELTKQLSALLSSTSSADIQQQQLLLQRILSSYEKSLLILKWSGSVGQSQPFPTAATPGMPESSITVDGSPRSEDFDKPFKDNQEQRPDVFKKRKVLPTWTEQVRICSETGLEGPNDDGYSWRKYGQKDILGAKYPRSYYRCTYRNVRSCWATKQVQRSDEDPTVFDITYKGKHTCSQVPNSVPVLPSPAKLEIKHNSNDNNNQQPQQANEMLLNFRANLGVDAEFLDNEIASPLSFPSPFECMTSESQMFSVSTLVDDNHSPFLSPAASESNYFAVSTCQLNSFGGGHHLQHSESGLTDIISATNSPIINLDFSIHPVDLDPNFPFDTPGYFTQFHS